MDGDRRHKAAAELGLQEIPCKICTVFDDAYSALTSTNSKKYLPYLPDFLAGKNNIIKNDVCFMRSRNVVSFFCEIFNFSPNFFDVLRNGAIYTIARKRRLEDFR